MEVRGLQVDQLPLLSADPEEEQQSLVFSGSIDVQPPPAAPAKGVEVHFQLPVHRAIVPGAGGPLHEEGDRVLDQDRLGRVFHINFEVEGPIVVIEGLLHDQILQAIAVAQ